jgi:hypothetical protein
MDRSLLLGAAGGAMAALGVWLVVSKVIDKQLESGAADLAPQIGVAVRTEVPPVVRAELTRTLAEYGFTQATGRQISSLLNNADRLGVL